MQVATTIAEIRARVGQARAAGKTVGFVPTMGALHVGHVSLIQAAAARCGFVVVSLFVNPTQFGPGEDFEKYPRPFDQDLAICEEHGRKLAGIAAAMGYYCQLIPILAPVAPASGGEKT